MNVKQLREFLSEFPDDMPVVTADSTGLVDHNAEYIGTAMVYRGERVINPFELPVSRYLYWNNGTDAIEVLVL